MATGSESSGGNKGSRIASSTAASMRGRNAMPFSMPEEGEVIPF